MLSSPSIPRLTLLLAWLAAACTVHGGAPAGTSSPEPISSAPTVPTATVSPSPTLSPTPSSRPTTPTPTPCRQAGRVEEGLVENGDFGRDLPFLVYLPPCQPSASAELPVLYLLHGLTGSPEQWLDLGLIETADGVIQRGDSPPFLIVMPWQRTGVELEPAVITGLLPQIERTYSVLADREHRALGGISRGAGWAFRIGFRHWQVFGAVGLHSPGLLAGDSFAIERWLPPESVDQQPRIWIDIGNRDPLLESTEELSDRLDELGLDHELHTREGWHDPDYWRQHLEEYLRWYSQAW